MPAHHIIHISDTHIGRDDPANTTALVAMVDRINALISEGVPVDLVVHTGDISDDGDAPDSDGSSARAAAAALARLDVPWLVLGGNHDRRRWLDAAFTDRQRGTPVADGLRLASVADIDCLLLDANPENGDDELSGRVDAGLLDALDRHLAGAIRPVLLLMHYPLAAMASDGWMEPVIGGARLHALLARHTAAVHAVLFGHVHRASARLLDGVLYVSAPGCRRHFLHWPAAGFADERTAQWGFNYLQLDTSGTQVQYHVLALA